MIRKILLLGAVALLLMQGRAAAQAPLADRPNDPRLRDQWAVQKIGLECAWTHITGSPDVTVAVIDSGIDLDHPDLKEAIRTDGFNTVDENDDPTDRNGHGTHVAGIIAATINNGEGIAGVAGGGTKILPIRVMEADGSGTNADIIEGIEYAISKKVQIINMSLGSLLPLESDDIVAAIERAHDAGILVVIAAGNSFVPLPNFAFGIERFAVVVAATDRQDRKTDFSNYGAWIAVSAPGDGIMSTMPTYDVFLTRNLPPEERFNKNYDALSGTSQATPIVSGVAALIFAAHPDWTADQVKAELQKTAVNIAEQNPTKQFGPITYFEASNLGAGRINACDALGGPLSGAAPTGGVNAPASNLPIWLAIAGGALLLLFAGFLVLRRRGRKAAPAMAGYGPYGPPPGGLPGQAPMGQSMVPPQQQSMGQSYPLPDRAPGATPSLGSPIGSPINPAAPAVPGGALPAWGKVTIERGPDQGRFFLLREPTTVIGRETGATIVLNNDPSISRRHALIRRGDRGAELEDAGSSHGTQLNGIIARGSQPLRSGDIIQIGQTVLRFEG